VFSCAKGQRIYSSYSFLTLVLDGDEWSASHAGRFISGKEPPVPIGEEADWASKLVWTQRLEEKFFASAGDGTLFIQSVVRHYTQIGKNSKNVLS
jgi:hypothetical protein